MRIDKIEKDEVKILTISGRLDANTAADLESQLLPLTDQISVKIIIDLEELEYISSAGLRILLLALKKTDQNRGTLVICGMKDLIKEVFKIAGFLQIFKITETRQEALKAL